MPVDLLPMQLRAPTSPKPLHPRSSCTDAVHQILRPDDPTDLRGARAPTPCVRSSDPRPNRPRRCVLGGMSARSDSGLRSSLRPPPDVDLTFGATMGTLNTAALLSLHDHLGTITVEQLDEAG